MRLLRNIIVPIFGLSLLFSTAFANETSAIAPQGEWAHNFWNFYSNAVRDGKEITYDHNLYPYFFKVDRDIPNFKNLSCTEMFVKGYEFKSGQSIDDPVEPDGEETAGLWLMRGLSLVAGIIAPPVGIAGLLMVENIENEIKSVFNKPASRSFAAVTASYLDFDINQKQEDELIESGRKQLLKWQKQLKKVVKEDVTMEDLKMVLVREDQNQNLCYRYRGTELTKFYWFFPYGNLMIKYLGDKGNFRGRDGIY